MGKYLDFFETQEQLDSWTRNSGSFRGKDEAISFIIKYGKKEDEYYVLERILN